MNPIQTISGGIALAMVVFGIIEGVVFAIATKKDSVAAGGIALLAAIPTALTLIVAACIFLVASL